MEPQSGHETHLIMRKQAFHGFPFNCGADDRRSQNGLADCVRRAVPAQRVES
jgi:hypothetical protein